MNLRKKIGKVLPVSALRVDVNSRKNNRAYGQILWNCCYDSA